MFTIKIEYITGRYSHVCCICSNETRTFWEDRNFNLHRESNYIKIGTRKICCRCFTLLKEETNDNEEKIIKLIKDKKYLSDLKERRNFEEFLYERNSDNFFGKQDGSFYCVVVGTRYEDRESNIEKMKIDSPVLLVRQPDNEYDSNAISVHTIIDEKEYDIGFVPAIVSETLAPMIDSGEKIYSDLHRLGRLEVKRYDYIEKNSEFIPYLTLEPRLILEIRIPGKQIKVKMEDGEGIEFKVEENNND